MKLIYLASPYSHPDPYVMEHRYEAACYVAGQLMQRGLYVFSPIAHTHRIGQLIGRQTDAEFWLQQDFLVLDRCDEMWVLMLAGWGESKGVQAEIARCKERGIPVLFLDPKDCHVEGDFC